MRILTILAAVVAALAGVPAAADQPKLTIYTYNSFTSEWGPGPVVTPVFEARCGCRIEWVALEDGAALLSRLQLEGEKTAADLVLGLDTNLTAEAAATGLFAPHGMDLKALTLPIAWTDPDFVPFDYGYFAFVYDSAALKSPPKSFAELAGPGAEPKLLLQDPRTSTPGLGLLLWVKQIYGDKAADAWRNLAPKILTVSKGWSESYGLFQKGEAPIVLSYTTSPAYHLMVDKTDRYRSLDFPEGNYLQVEVAGMLKTSAHQDLARQFLDFMVSAEFQKAIPTTNWMYPVGDIGTDLPQVFRDLPKPAKTLLYPPEEVAAHRQAWIQEWLDIVSR
jgi:thiamine transport system substrate-binding protein